MRLFIAEKPNVGKAIASALGVKKYNDGYAETKTGDLVTWCFGHLMEQSTPEAYLPDEGKKRWRKEDLPIVPSQWQLEIKESSKKQFKLIGQLLKKCSSVVNCGDIDREGQLLVDEILEHYKNKKTVYRYWSSANDDQSVKEALANLKPNSNYKGMRDAALARSHADWLIGMNGTRAFTLAAQEKVGGKVPVLSVGRVQTPTLNLVATRDLAIKNFKPKNYFVFEGLFKASGISFKAKYQVKDDVKLDSEKRLIDATIAKALYDKIKDLKSAVVSSFETKAKKIAPPKGYSLADIQNAANSKFGYSAEQTLNICQALYETHKLTSYPRSDCQFLPTSQLKDAKDIFSALLATNPDLKSILSKADLSIKSKIFDDSKISAHHAIIPTRQKGDINSLSEQEKNVYNLIVKRYIAQFYPDCTVSETKLVLDAQGETFSTSGSIIIDKGFKVIDDADSSKSDNEESQTLPKLAKDQSVELLKVSPITKKTTAPAAFTEGSLIKAMENIASVVDDPVYKKLLKNVKGIGTSATRAAIIAELKRKNYMTVAKNKVHVTDLGFKLLNSLPDLVKNPVLTAMFESTLEKIAEGKASLQDFEAKQVEFVKDLIKKADAINIDIKPMAAKSKTTSKKKLNYGTKKA